MDIPCRIVDLSLMGCLVETQALPGVKEQEKVWLRPLGIAASEWTEGTVVAVRKPFFRPCQVRIRFRDDLSYESFKPLVFGEKHPQAEAVVDAPEHERDHLWR